MRYRFIYAAFVVHSVDHYERVREFIVAVQLFLFNVLSAEAEACRIAIIAGVLPTTVHEPALVVLQRFEEQCTH